MTEPAAPRWPDPVPGKVSDVDPELWAHYLTCKASAGQWDDMARKADAQIHEQIGDAAILFVDGRKVAVRVVQDVTGASWRKDFFRRTGGTATLSPNPGSSATAAASPSPAGGCTPRTATTRFAHTPMSSASAPAAAGRNCQ